MALIPAAILGACLNEGQHFVGHVLEPFRLGLHPKNREAGLELRRLNVGDEPPFEAGAQSILEPGNLLRRAVRGQHDLSAGPVE